MGSVQLRDHESVPIEKEALARWGDFKVGKALANSNRSLALVRIPKVASSNLRTSLQLVDWVDCGELDLSTTRILLFLRNPISRFLSGIPETLLRATPRGGEYSGDVEVSPSIYEQICDLDVSSPGKLVKGFSEIITSNGYFDPHHFPSVWFCYTRDRFPRCEPEIFDVSAVSSFVESRHRIALGGRKFENSRNPILTSSRSRCVKRAIGRLRATIWPSYRRNFPTTHPLSRLSGRKGRSLSSVDVGDAVMRLYATITQDPESNEIAASTTQAMYRDDLRMYEHFFPDDWSRESRSKYPLGSFQPVKEVISQPLPQL